MMHGYVRVSSADQGESGLGLEAQADAIRRYCGDQPVTIHSDTCKSQVPLDERPAFLVLMGAVSQGDTVVVAKLDRIARDMHHHLFAEAMFGRMGVALVSVAGEGVGDDSPMGVLMRRMLQAFSEFERAMIRVRTKAALRVLQGEGRHLGRQPALSVITERRRGTEGAGIAVPDVEAIAALRAARAAGAGWASLAERSELLTGRRWSASTLRRVLS